MFLGAEGTGPLPLAIAYAQYINCRQRSEKDSCGVCPSCHKFSKYIHPDLHFAFPVVSSSEDGTKKKLCDDYLPEWRQFLEKSEYFSLNQWITELGAENKQAVIYTNEADIIVRKLSLKSYEAEYKTMIIWMPEKMRVEAANKLLKIIEEPPDKTLFLLVAADAGEILPTIFSRTQIIKIPKIDDQSLAETLTSKHGANRLILQDAILQANGNYLEALDSIEMSDETKLNASLFVSLFRVSYSFKAKEITNWVNRFAELGRESQKVFFNFALKAIREIFVDNINMDKIFRMAKFDREFQERFKFFIDEQNTNYLVIEFEKAAYHIERNAFDKIVALDIIIKIKAMFQNLKK